MLTLLWLLLWVAWGEVTCIILYPCTRQCDSCVTSCSIAASVHNTLKAVWVEKMGTHDTLYLPYMYVIPYVLITLHKYVRTHTGNNYVGYFHPAFAAGWQPCGQESKNISTCMYSTKVSSCINKPATQRTVRVAEILQLCGLHTSKIHWLAVIP